MADFLDMFSHVLFVVFFFKQKTAYEMSISDWSSDVCSSDLVDQPIGLYRRGRVRDFASRRTRRGLRRRAGRRTRDQADRAGRARFVAAGGGAAALRPRSDRKSTRLNSSH